MDGERNFARQNIGQPKGLARQTVGCADAGGGDIPGACRVKSGQSRRNRGQGVDIDNQHPAAVRDNHHRHQQAVKIFELTSGLIPVISAIVLITHLDHDAASVRPQIGDELSLFINTDIADEQATIRCKKTDAQLMPWGDRACGDQTLNDNRFKCCTTCTCTRRQTHAKPKTRNQSPTFR